MMRTLTLLAGILIASDAFAADPPMIDESLYQLEGADLLIPDWAGKREDEPFNVREFLESRMPPERNAAPLYLYAARKIGGDTTGLQKLPDTVEDGKVIKNFQVTSPRHTDSQWIKENATSAEARKLLRGAAEGFQLIDAAQERPECVFVTGLQHDSATLPMGMPRSLGPLSALEIANASAAGDFDRADLALKRALRFSRDLRPRGPVIHQLYASAVEANALRGIVDSYLASKKLKVADCDRLIALLQEHQKQSVDSLTEGLRMDYIGLASLLHMYDAGLAPEKMTIENSGIFNFDLEFQELNRLYSLVLKAAADEPDTRRTFQFIDAERNRLREKAAGELLLVLPMLGTLDKSTFKMKSVAFVLQSWGSPNQFIDVMKKKEATLNGTLCLIAVRRYQLEHNKKSPSDLETALREAGIDEVPRDPYDGRSMKYASVFGRPVVYAIGLDRQDDSGLIESFGANQPGDLLLRLP